MLLRGKILMSPPSAAVEVEPARRRAEYLFTRDGVGDGVDQPVDRGLVGELAFMADEGAVARPYQPVRAGDAQQLARILPGLRPEPVAAGNLDPGAALVDGLQQALEAVAVDAGFRLGPAEMIDHELDAGGFQHRQDFWQVFTFD